MRVMPLVPSFFAGIHSVGKLEIEASSKGNKREAKENTTDSQKRRLSFSVALSKMAAPFSL